MIDTLYPHIEQRQDGKLIVVGTGLKVILLIGEHIAWGYDAAQLHLQHPGLSLAAAHSVLAYFYDNQDAIRAEIAEREAEAERFFAARKQPSRDEFLARIRAKAVGEKR